MSEESKIISKADLLAAPQAAAAASGLKTDDLDTINGYLEKGEKLLNLFVKASESPLGKLLVARLSGKPTNATAQDVVRANKMAERLEERLK